MSSPYEKQATYYRTALLLGLVDGATVHDWALRVIEQDGSPPPAFFELISIDPTDLSALRRALWTLAIEPDPQTVLESLLARLGVDLAAGRRGLPDTITVLRQMRSMLRLPAEMYASLNAALVAQAREGQAQAIVDWLAEFAEPDGPEPGSRR